VTGTVVVIGGPGGLASAMLFARRSFRLRVFKKTRRIGHRTEGIA
jgi:phytoene dehydrogenase-like protein